MEKNLHGITVDQEIIKEDQHVALKLHVSGQSDFFDGLFPEFKLLPAVAQIEIITRLAGIYFGTKRFIPSIRRIKFSSPILPDAEVLLEMKYDSERSSVSYTLSDFSHETVYSTGTFKVEKE